jgi:hypothetical protein
MTLAGPKKVDSIAATGGDFSQTINEIDAADALLQGSPHQLRYPNNGHSIGHYHFARTENVPQILVLHGVLEEVNIGRCYLMEATLPNLFFNKRDRFIHGHILEGNTKNSYSAAR